MFPCDILFPKSGHGFSGPHKASSEFYLFPCYQDFLDLESSFYAKDCANSIYKLPRLPPLS